MIHHGLLAQVRGDAVHASAAVQALMAGGKAAKGVKDGDGFLAELHGHLQAAAVKDGKGAGSEVAERAGATNGLKLGLASTQTVVKTEGAEASMNEAAAANKAEACGPLDAASQAAEEISQAPQETVMEVAAAPVEVEKGIEVGRAVQGRMPDEIGAGEPLAKSVALNSSKVAETQPGKSGKGTATKSGVMPETLINGNAPMEPGAVPVLNQPGVLPTLPLIEAKGAAADDVNEVAAVGKPMVQKRSAKDGPSSVDARAPKGHGQAAAVPVEAGHEVSAARVAETEQVVAVAVMPAKTPDAALGVAPVTTEHHGSAAVVQETRAQSAGHALHVEKSASSRWQEPEVVKTYASTPRVLEVGLSDGVHGWLRVRAQAGDGGEISASLMAASSGQAEALRRKLPGISEYLASESVGVSSLVVNAGAAMAGAQDSTMNFGAGTGAGFGASSEQENQGAKPGQGTHSSPETGPGAREPEEWGGEVGLREFSGNRSGGWLSVLA